MQMPQLTDQHKFLTRFAGTWSGDEKLFPSPWDPSGGPAKGRVVARLELDGFFVVSDYTQERGGAVAYRGHGVYGWDDQAKTFTMHWFDSSGMVMPGPARGTFDGKTLTFTSESPMGMARYIYTFESDTKQLFRMESSQDGKTWAPFMEAVYTKV